jgi:hypothetical protein
MEHWFSPDVDDVPELASQSPSLDLFVRQFALAE